MIEKMIESWQLSFKDTALDLDYLAFMIPILLLIWLWYRKK